jgi:hypothetical protein
MACIRIERIQNGFTVSVTDPKIVAANEARSGKDVPSSKWMDPCREYRFDNEAAVVKFVEKVIVTALPAESTPPDSFAKAFDAAVKATSDNDGDE